jgi:large subunit ribosomal protein L31
MKNNHPKLQLVTFKCASCGAIYEIESTLKQKEINIDVCASCHPIYIGSGTEQKVKGRAEKLSSKFIAGKETLENKTIKKERKTKKQTKGKSKKNVVTSLDDL